LNKNNKLKKH